MNQTTVISNIRIFKMFLSLNLQLVIVRKYPFIPNKEILYFRAKPKPDHFQIAFICTLAHFQIFKLTPLLSWTCKEFEKLDLHELYDILHLRNAVFIVEQNCPYQDCDHKDFRSLHLMGKENGKLLAYARLIPPGISYRESSIGRVVSSPDARGKGLGKQLMWECIQQIEKKFHSNSIRIGAQLYLEHFYTSFGFIRDSDVYLEDNIPHVEMLIKPK
jgi:ElaA protein